MVIALRPVLGRVATSILVCAVRNGIALPFHPGWLRLQDALFCGSRGAASLRPQMVPPVSRRGMVPLGATGAGAENPHAPGDGVRLGSPMILTQLPAGNDFQQVGPASGRMLRAAYGQRGRLLLVLPDGTQRVLSRSFHSACDPEVSFDGTRILFAGKRTEVDRWNIYEMGVDGSGVRQITRDLGDCRSPGYQSTLYTLNSPGPWYQITLVSNAAGQRNEFGSDPATDLYSCKLDGSEVRRLTYNPSSDFDPFLMPDGRLLFASWQRHGLESGPRGRIGLFGVNLDGTDYARFAADEGRPIKQMPCITGRGVVVFVEADEASWDGAGCLSCVGMRRPLHSYRQITKPSDGLFHSPSPLPDGRILVSRRPTAGVETHGVYRFDPSTGKAEPVFDDPAYHDIQAKLVLRRSEPDGRSSVVSEEDPNGRLYCLDVYTSDLPDGRKMSRGSVKRLRVLEAVLPRRTGRRRGRAGAVAANSRRGADRAGGVIQCPGAGQYAAGTAIARRRRSGDPQLRLDLGEESRVAGMHRLPRRWRVDPGKHPHRRFG